MICPNCGKTVPASDKHCVYCGKSLGSLLRRVPTRVKWLSVLAIVIAIVSLLAVNLFPGQAPEERQPSVILSWDSDPLPITRPTIYSDYISGTPPAIDGILTPGEWAEPDFTKPFEYTVKGVPTVGEMAGYFLNDEHSLYIATTVGGDGMQHSVTEEDWVWFTLTLHFDGENDGVIGDGEDIRLLHSSQAGSWEQSYYMDEHINLSEYGSYIKFGSDGSEGDDSGEGAVTFSKGDNSYTYEFRIPLNSGDPNDLAVDTGDTIGIKITISEMVKVGEEYRESGYRLGYAGWPIAVYEATTDISTYGKLVLAVAPN